MDIVSAIPANSVWAFIVSFSFPPFHLSSSAIKTCRPN